uniref:Uncharacterized protein n=1 Tax=Arundo donax TaxID=35708 RepID=A0A0A9EA75_ARUDO
MVVELDNYNFRMRVFLPLVSSDYYLWSIIVPLALD